ncbi:MAG: DNA-processing protein DprA [Phycisphaerales bacterium]
MPDSPIHAVTAAASPTERSVADAERLARIAWLQTEGIGGTRCGRLIDDFGSASAAIEASAEAVAAAIGARAETAARWREQARRARDESAKREFDRCVASGVELAMPGDAGYPALLSVIPDAPPLLWLRGSLVARANQSALPSGGPRDRGVVGFDEPRVAIVGSRRATAYGLEQASRFAGALAASGVAIVSGGARGIDAASHRAALRTGGRTIAVLGSGLDRPYPPEHPRLFEAIVEGGGAVVSEFPLATDPRPGLFPRRNRIVSGLSLGVLVVEAALRSGAMITARLAVEEHGREAMAIPGRVDAPRSAGCLRAIREGWAALVSDVSHVFEQLGGAGMLLRGAAEQAANDSAGEPAQEGAVRRAIRAAMRELCGDEASMCESIVAATGLEVAIVRRELVLMRIDQGRMR